MKKLEGKWLITIKDRWLSSANFTTNLWRIVLVTETFYISILIIYINLRRKIQLTMTFLYYQSSSKLTDRKIKVKVKKINN